MRACVQRSGEASVTVGGKLVGQIDRGFVVLLGVAQDDTEADARFMADKIVDLRVFEDDEGKMNRSLVDVGGAMLVVSQFTLLGDCRKGRRPSFVHAAPPELAEQLYQTFVDMVRGRGIEVATGVFREMMQVSLVNDGPVTMLLDSRKLF
jgi:D-tyrosyl-tRNA(Tyr) deacylase